MNYVEAVPIFSDVPAGSKITVKGPDGSILVEYTLTVDVPSGSSLAITKP